MGIHDGHRVKLRARFLTAGLDAFADHEALELLLYYAIPRRDTNPIAHELMDRFGTLSGVLSAPVELLKQVDGVGESAAVLLRLAPLLAQKARLAEAEREGLAIYEYDPSQVKSAVTGYGKAEKRQVMDMTKRLLHLNAVPKPDDAADAVAIALCHARSSTSLLQK